MMDIITTIQKKHQVKFLKLDDYNLSYFEVGSATIPIIFIHGFPLNKSSWSLQLDYLKSHHRAIAYDIRGFGDSTAGEQQAGIAQYADDLIHFMDALGAEKAIVCGLSMGGYILLNAASRYPDRFKGLILCDTQCIADTEEIKEKRAATIEKIKKEGLKNFAKDFLNKAVHKSDEDSEKSILSDLNQMIIHTPVERIAAGLHAMAQRKSSCDKLNQIKAPTLIMCGKEDTITPPIESEFLNISIKNSKLIMIPQAGHLTNVEQPDLFNGHLLTFINQQIK